MPWEPEGEGIRFSGNLAELMNHVMANYEEDTEAATVTTTPGVYATASAIVLREIIIEALEEQPETEEFLARLSAGVSEDDEGYVEVQTLAILDDVADHIEDAAWQAWLADSGVRAAVAEVCDNTFSE